MSLKCSACKEIVCPQNFGAQINFGFKNFVKTLADQTQLLSVGVGIEFVFPCHKKEEGKKKKEGTHT